MWYRSGDVSRPPSVEGDILPSLFPWLASRSCLKEAKMVKYAREPENADRTAKARMRRCGRTWPVRESSYSKQPCP